MVKDLNGEGVGWQRDRMAEGLMGKEVRAGGDCESWEVRLEAGRNLFTELDVGVFI